MPQPILYRLSETLQQYGAVQDPRSESEQNASWKNSDNDNQLGWAWLQADRELASKLGFEYENSCSTVFLERNGDIRCEITQIDDQFIDNELLDIPKLLLFHALQERDGLSLSWCGFVALMKSALGSPRILDLIEPPIDHHAASNVGDLLVEKDGSCYLSLWTAELVQSDGRTPRILYSRFIAAFSARLGQVPEPVVLGPQNLLVQLLKRCQVDPDQGIPAVSQHLALKVATQGWQAILHRLEQDVEKRPRAHRVDGSSGAEIGADIQQSEDVEYMLEEVITRLQANKFALTAMGSWSESYSQTLHKSFSYPRAIQTLERRLDRAQYLLRRIWTRKDAASRKANSLHSTRLETFTWYNLRVGYAVEAIVKKAAIIFCILAPAVFVSTFFSSNFFIINSDTGGFKASSEIWIWFAVSVPLGILMVMLLLLVRFNQTRALSRQLDP